LHIDYVLDAQRNSVQRAPISALSQLFPEAVRLVSCRFAINEDPGPHTFFPAINLCQAFL
jgi:hypothetical protein